MTLLIIIYIDDTQGDGPLEICSQLAKHNPAVIKHLVLIHVVYDVANYNIYLRYTRGWPHLKPKVYILRVLFLISHSCDYSG